MGEKCAKNEDVVFKDSGPTICGRHCRSVCSGFSGFSGFFRFFLYHLQQLDKKIKQQKKPTTTTEKMRRGSPSRSLISFWASSAEVNNSNILGTLRKEQ